MKTIMTHLFTGKDNQTFDIGRVLWVLGVLSYIGYAGFHVIANHAFDPMAYGGGLGAVLAGGGAALGMKAGTEP